MEQDPYDPHYDGENDEYEFTDHDPTLEDCIRLWRQALTWYKHDTLYGVCEFAAMCARTRDDRALWIESVQRIRSEGLIDRDTAANLLYHIVDESLDDEPVHENDARLEEISDQIEEIHRAHGRTDDLRFTPWHGPLPPQLKVLLDASVARELELIADILYDEGEKELATLIRDDPDEFARRNAAAEAKIRRDFAAERERWMPLDAQWRARLELDANPG